MFDNVGRLIIALSRQEPSRSAEDTVRELLTDEFATIDWATFLDQTVQHKVAPLVWSNLDRLNREHQGIRVDRSTGSTLRAVHLFHSERNKLALAELHHVLDAAEARSLQVVPRKGAQFMQDVYREPALRPIGDIDVLVPREQAADLVSLLKERGYQEGLPDGTTRIRRLSRRENLFWQLYGSDLPKLNKVTGNPYLPLIAMDVNISLVLPGTSAELPVPALIKRSVRHEISGRKQRFLSPVDCVLDLCLHIYKNSTTLRFMNDGKHRLLLKYVDLVEYLSAYRHEFSWRTFLETAARYEVLLPVFYTLAHIDRIFPREIPSEVLAECGRSRHDKDEFLNQYGQWDAPEPSSWTVPFEKRFFSRDADLTIPQSKALL